MGIYVTKPDIYNMQGGVRNAEMGGVTAIQWLELGGQASKIGGRIYGVLILSSLLVK
jgi:hypothetical protein